MATEMGNHIYELQSGKSRNCGAGLAMACDTPVCLPGQCHLSMAPQVLCYIVICKHICYI